MCARMSKRMQTLSGALDIPELRDTALELLAKRKRVPAAVIAQAVKIVRQLRLRVSAEREGWESAAVTTYGLAVAVLTAHPTRLAVEALFDALRGTRGDQEIFESLGEIPVAPWWLARSLVLSTALELEQLEILGNRVIGGYEPALEFLLRRMTVLSESWRGIVIDYCADHGAKISAICAELVVRYVLGMTAEQWGSELPHPYYRALAAIGPAAAPALDFLRADLQDSSLDDDWHALAASAIASIAPEDPLLEPALRRLLERSVAEPERPPTRQVLQALTALGTRARWAEESLDAICVNASEHWWKNEARRTLAAVRGEQA